MFEIIKSTEFQEWVAGLHDRQAVARIAARLDNAANGNLGDWKAVRGALSEMRIHTGKGYRLYFTRRGNAVIVLLSGGGKASQEADIKRALEILKEWKD
jgi:putative addiction module killer protein